jgi:alpha-tubulin suppressor-like RCC1 family protein
VGPALATTATTALAFYQVAVGVLHTCGVTTDRRLYCWGHNLEGELGDGTTTMRLTPVLVKGGHRFRQVSAGFSHTCGVTTEYRAYCWGSNFEGALGDGTTINRLTPVLVTGGRQYRRVEISSFYACGVSYPDSRAYCWGDNVEGEHGDGTTTNRLRPVAVLGGRKFRQVSTGWFHACGVTTDDRAFCWGDNEAGQIGDSSEVRRRLRPSRVAGAHQFRQLSAGSQHTCGVTTDDRA